MPRGRITTGPGGNLSFGAVLAFLVVLALAIAVAGAAAVVTIPGSIVVLSLVIAKPEGAGMRVRQWRLWRRVRGLEPTRRRATFTVVLSLYGILVPGACAGIIAAAAVGSVNNRGSQPVTAVVPPTATAGTTSGPSETPDSTAAPTGPPTPAPTPPPAPALPVDPCHVSGVTYCSLNPDVTQASIHSTICVSGWTATVRPPESYTYNLKRRQMAEEGLPGTTGDYEEDHRMPLELGGAPSDVDNLSPESPPSPNPKDSDENRLKYAVCDGGMSLLQAQEQMVSAWLAAYPRYTH